MTTQKKILVLGAGMVGSAMAADLAERSDFAVTVADARRDALARVRAKNPRIECIEGDLSSPAAVKKLAANADVVVGALASVLGLQTLRAVIEAKKPYVDISFMADDALSLNALAKEHGVTAVVDCGVAPGLSNLLIGQAMADLDRTTSIEVYVGGLPEVRRWPYEYKAPFAPYDVIEEYIRPSRVVEHGKIVVKEALSEPELMDFPGIGTLEAFNTDGLRSLAGLDVPDMKEKTLRYPGHIALMRAMRETGLFSTTPITVNGQTVVPRDVTSALLFPKWAYEEGEADLTVLRVVVEGKKGDVHRKTTWDMLDRYDPKSKLRSMSRTTGYPATLVAGLLADGVYAVPGVHAPEDLGRQPGLTDKVLAGLATRGITLSHRVLERVASSP